ncbi:hypothetical protein [Pararhodobacter oceanensis]|uniref:hypothetical protein n=1 Tax=Pararhodobacter oceanensis TaxID=2172121 RepID=UPI003A9108FE
MALINDGFDDVWGAAGNTKAVRQRTSCGGNFSVNYAVDTDFNYIAFAQENLMCENASYREYDFLSLKSRHAEAEIAATHFALSSRESRWMLLAPTGGRQIFQTKHGLAISRRVFGPPHTLELQEHAAPSVGRGGQQSTVQLTKFVSGAISAICFFVAAMGVFYSWEAISEADANQLFVGILAMIVFSMIGGVAAYVQRSIIKGVPRDIRIETV